MYPLRELQRLLTAEDPLPGVVVATSSGAVTCATPNGLREARVTGRSIAVGEAVTVRSGVASPRATPAETFTL